MRVWYLSHMRVTKGQMRSYITNAYVEKPRSSRQVVFSLFSKVDNKPFHSQEDYLARLCECASSPDHLLLACAIST